MPANIHPFDSFFPLDRAIRVSEFPEWGFQPEHCKIISGTWTIIGILTRPSRRKENNQEKEFFYGEAKSFWNC